MTRSTTEERHKEVKEAFDKLSNKKNGKGIRIYSINYIISELAHKFHYTEKTIEYILKK